MEGVIYYNIGMKCLVRLVVSLHTLRKVYAGAITIISDADCLVPCTIIAKQFNADVIVSKFDTAQGKNMAFLNKCRMHQVTPYDKTLFIDSDTIVMKDFSDCFALLDEHEFIVPQFCDWKTSGSRYKSRIKSWEGHISEALVRHAFDEPKAVNIGFYGWKKGAKIFDGWFDLALKNRDSFIPDEVACQIILPHVPHLVIGSEYNTSCKYEPLTENTRTLHFHGRKHCRVEACKYLYHSDLWYSQFDEVRIFCANNGFIQYDRMLLRYIYSHDIMRMS